MESRGQAKTGVRGQFRAANGSMKTWSSIGMKISRCSGALCRVSHGRRRSTMPADARFLGQTASRGCTGTHGRRMKINFLTPDLWDLRRRHTSSAAARFQSRGLCGGRYRPEARQRRHCGRIVHNVRRDASQPSDPEADQCPAAGSGADNRSVSLGLASAMMACELLHRSLSGASQRDDIEGPGVAIMEFPQTVPRKSFRSHTGIVQYLNTARHSRRIGNFQLSDIIHEIRSARPPVSVTAP